MSWDGYGWDHPDVVAWLDAHPMSREEAQAVLDAGAIACACIGSPPELREAGLAGRTPCYCALRYAQVRRTGIPIPE